MRKHRELFLCAQPTDPKKDILQDNAAVLELNILDSRTEMKNHSCGYAYKEVPNSLDRPSLSGEHTAGAMSSDSIPMNVDGIVTLLSLPVWNT